MIPSIGYTELIVLAIVAVVLFGRKLPEVARSVGSSYAQFRKGLSDLQSTIDHSDMDLSAANLEYEQELADRVEPSGPRFQPPPVEDLSSQDKTDG